MNEELKPCPSCNGQNIKIAHIICPRKIRSRYIVCEDCGYCGKTKITKRQAIKAWDREWDRRTNDG